MIKLITKIKFKTDSKKLKGGQLKIYQYKALTFEHQHRFGKAVLFYEKAILEAYNDEYIELSKD